MLTVSEEILLLTLDDRKGAFLQLPVMAKEYALAGALLMDLAFADRIDTDLQRLFLAKEEPTGDAILDEVLGEIRSMVAIPEKKAEATAEKTSGDAESKNAVFWVELLARRSDYFQDRLLERLTERGILKREDHRILWVFHTRRYPVINNREEREVKMRIGDVLFGDGVPSSRDIAIISLAHACSLLTEIFAWREIEAVQDRIEQVCRMDLVGRAVFQAINELRMNSIAATMQGPPLTL